MEGGTGEVPCAYVETLELMGLEEDEDISQCMCQVFLNIDVPSHAGSV